MTSTIAQRAIAITELRTRADWYRRRVKDNKRKDIVLSAEQKTKAEALEAVAADMETKT